MKIQAINNTSFGAIKPKTTTEPAQLPHSHMPHFAPSAEGVKNPTAKALMLESYVMPSIQGNLHSHMAKTSADLVRIHNSSDIKTIIKMHTTPNAVGRLAATFEGEGKLAEIHGRLPKKVIKFVHNHPDSFGRKVIHYASLITSELAETHRVFAKDKNFLAKLHTSDDKIGNMAMHYAKEDGFLLINELFEQKPSVLAEIYLSKGRFKDKMMPVVIEKVKLLACTEEKLPLAVRKALADKYTAQDASGVLARAAKTLATQLEEATVKAAKKAARKAARAAKRAL